MRRVRLLGLLSVAVTVAACGGGGAGTTTVTTTVTTSAPPTTVSTSTTVPGTTTSGATVTTATTATTATTTGSPALGRTNYLIVWEDGRNVSSSGWDIFGRMLGSDGKPAGDPIRVSGGDATDSEYEPAVAWNPDAGEYLVVWEDARNLGSSGIDIFGRRIASGGEPIGAAFRVSNGPVDESSATAVWNASNGEYLVVWEDDRDATTRGLDIYARRIAADGTPVGTAFRVGDGGATDTSPAVAWNETDNQYLIVWEDRRVSGESTVAIFGRIVTADGVPLDQDIRLGGSAAPSEYKPAVVWSAVANEYLVVWEDGRDRVLRGIDIYGRRVSASGAPIDTSFLVSSESASGDEGAPGVAASQVSGNYLVVWTDGRDQATRGVDLYGIVIAPDGTPIGSELRVSGANAIEDEGAPAVVWDTSDRYVVVWEDGRNRSTTGSDIVGRIIESDGSRIGAEFRASRAESNEYAPALG